MVVVFEDIAPSPDVKHRFFLAFDGLGEVEDSLLTIPVTLDKKDPLLTEQRVFYLISFLVNNDQLIVFGGDKDVVGEVFWLFDHGHVNHLLTNTYLIHTEISRLVGQIKYNQAVSVSNYEKR